MRGSIPFVPFVHTIRVPAGVLAAACLALAFAAAAGAQPSDHPLFGGFPDAEISEFENEERVNHQVVLGGLQQLRGQVVPQAAERVRGKLTRILYEVASGYSGRDVMDFFAAQMRSMGYRELYSCAGRACGSSEYWANDIFGKRILYGPVRNQLYLAMGSEPPGRFYVSVYVITRINRQLLAYLEIVEPEGGAKAPAATSASPAASSPNVPSPEAMLAQLREQRGLVVPGLGFTANDELASRSSLGAIVEMMELDPQLRLRIVAHLQGDGSLEDLLSRSESRAEAVRQSLLAAGADPARLSTRGLGPLAPLCASGNCAERVELILDAR